MSKGNGQAGTVTVEHGTASLCQGIAAALEAGSAVALTRGASDRLHGAGHACRAVGKQVYLRFVGTRDGEIIKTTGSGPWDVALTEGNEARLDPADRAELERDRSYLEKERGMTGLVLEMSTPVDGILKTWEPVVLKEPEDTPLKRAAFAAMELFDMIDKLPDADAVKAIEVIKSRAAVSMITSKQRKAVGHG